MAGDLMIQHLETIDDNIVISRLNENKFYSDEVRVNYRMPKF